MKLASVYFYGNEASEYAKENGFLDYGTLAKAFNHVLANDIMETTSKLGVYDWDTIGYDGYNEDTDGYREIYQFYIVDESGAEILQEVGEIVYYSETLNMYLWGVTHWGTSWNYVLTNIPLNCGYEEQ